MGTALNKLLREAEEELAGVRQQRSTLDRAERIASERVAHLRALVELETGASTSGQPASDAKRPSTSEDPDRAGGPREPDVPDPTQRVELRGRFGIGALNPVSDGRPEDIAAEVLSERGPLHYRELWEEVARRGGNIVSGNPAAVLLTRISRDDRFAKAKARGVYRLAVGDESKGPMTTPRRRKRRRRARKRPAPTASP